ncbi:hypothetical protein AMR41_10510 [Hapalosiphon sp. MRB220]|nr:hypothetical protein AMR41_10510 [Hapalosiphon sp. MRB220]
MGLLFDFCWRSLRSALKKLSTLSVKGSLPSRVSSPNQIGLLYSNKLKTQLITSVQDFIYYF